jgi:hypothetical protein
LTNTGVVLGTPSYMAPEQARGQEAVDARADVFALGCVLFECLTGSRPFEGDTAMAILGKLLFEEAPPVSALWPEVPEDLDALVARMLAKDPAIDRTTPRNSRPSCDPRACATSRRLAAAPSVRRMTTTERRLVCVVMVASTLELDATMTGDQTIGASDRGTVEEVAHMAAAAAARRPAPAPGRRRYIVAISGGGEATEQAVRAALRARDRGRTTRASRSPPGAG